MQLALAAVYFILPADGVIPPAASDLLTDGSTVFQLSPGETNKYDFLLGENISEIFGERWWVMVVMASWSRLLTPANSHLQPIKAERNLVLQGVKTTAFNQQWVSYTDLKLFLSNGHKYPFNVINVQDKVVSSVITIFDMNPSQQKL